MSMSHIHDAGRILFLPGTTVSTVLFDLITSQHVYFIWTLVLELCP
jgi:hypothetical protein